MKFRSPIRAMMGLTGVMFVLAAVAMGQSQPSPSTPTPPAPAPSKPTDDSTMPNLVYVQMTTSKGDIVLELNHEKAPISVKNFLSYVEKGYYNGTIFHRVMGKANTPNKADFMIQGGGFTPDMTQKKTDPPIKNEWRNGLKNQRGTIAMARLGQQPDSATSQFFINVADNPMLDEARFDQAGYAVFGKVVAGMNVVDAIKDVPTHSTAGHSNVPVEPIIIEKVKKISQEDAKKLIEPEKATTG